MAQQSQHGRRLTRGISSWYAVSFSLHVGGAALIAFSWPPSDLTEEHTIGSDALDVELLEHRLAPPIQRNGQDHSASKAGTGRLAFTKSGPSAAPKMASLAQNRASLVPHLSAQEKTLARAKRASAAENECLVAVSPRRPRASLKPQSPVLAALEAKPKSQANPKDPRLKQKTPLATAPDPEGRVTRESRVPFSAPDLKLSGAARLASMTTLPHEIAPQAVASAVLQEQARRREKNQTARQEVLRRQQLIQQRLAAMDASVAPKTGQGPSAPGEAGATRASNGHLGPSGNGVDPAYGLRFYLAGKPVKSTRTVYPPQPTRLPAIRCKVARLDIPAALVRLLVEADGKVGYVYLKKSSSNQRFDACATEHARRIQFKPGHDSQGTPLPVWINLRVEPSPLEG